MTTPEEFERMRYESLDRTRIELRRALCQTQGELSRLRASCYALDALLAELGFPAVDEREDRFGYDAARRVSQMRADLAREIDTLEKRLNDDSRRWVALVNAIIDEPEYREAAKSGRVDIDAVAIAVIERLRKEAKVRR